MVVDILRQINAEKQISLIFTTHDRAQAAALTRNVLVLEGGILTKTAYENVFTGAVEKRGASAYRFRIRNGLAVELAKHRIDPRRSPRRQLSGEPVARSRARGLVVGRLRPRPGHPIGITDGLFSHRQIPLVIIDVHLVRVDAYHEVPCRLARGRRKPRLDTDR